jgi:hypothetical protein
MATHWKANRRFFRPPERQATLDRPGAKPAFVGPFRQAKRSAMSGYQAIVARVLVLLSVGRPSAIARSIRTIVVNSVEAQVWGASPHVGEEPPEIRKPLGGHVDATPAVTRIAGVAWIVTALLGCAPCVMCPGSSMPVYVVAFLSQATTTAALAVPERVGPYCPSIATVATAKPGSVAFQIWCASENQQAGEAFPGEVDQRHGLIIAQSISFNLGPSRWAVQVGYRSARLARMMRTDSVTT